MYDNFKVANYSNALLSPELYARPLSRLYTGDVIDGLTVIPGTGLQVTLQTGNTLVRYGSAAVASARIVSLVADFNLAIGTPDASNPRHDLVVLYIDNGVTLPGGTPTAANLDGKGVPKAKIVPGTAASSPVDPNGTAIQASVGAGNPYIILARVRVDVGVSVIAGNKITDLRTRALVPAEKIDWATSSGATTQWRSWTPTLTNFTGTINVAKYTLIGKVCHFYIKITQGASVTGQHVLSLPVEVSSDQAFTQPINSLGVTGYIQDTGTAQFTAHVQLLTSTTIGLLCYSTNSSYLGPVPTSATIPMVWAAGSDMFTLQGSYETV